MTSQEARLQVDACERQITGSYSNLWAAARSVGSSAAQAASKKTTISPLLPIIISMFGLILCYGSDLFLGVALIIAGIVIAYKAHESAANVQKQVEQTVRDLYNTLDSNSKI